MVFDGVCMFFGDIRMFSLDDWLARLASLQKMLRPRRVVIDGNVEI